MENTFKVQGSFYLDLWPCDLKSKKVIHPTVVSPTNKQKEGCKRLCSYYKRSYWGTTAYRCRRNVSIPNKCTTTLYDTKFATHLQHDLLITDPWRHFLPKFPERDANENIIICEILRRNQPNFSCMFILAYLFNALLIAWPGRYEIWWCIRCLEQGW